MSAQIERLVSDSPSDRRVYRYLRHNPGWLPRDRIMHWTGFPSPKEQPVCAYVSFANCILRLNRTLRRHGKIIEQDAEENYRLGDVA